MKNHLLEKLNQSYKVCRLMLIGIFTLVSTFSSAQLCGTVVSGEAFLCTSSVETYVATRGVPGSILSWSLSGGGVITSITNNDTEATIQWNSTTGGPYRITVSEVSDGCEETVVFDVVIESNNINLTCNDMVNVALNQNCQAEITADMLLENPLYDEGSYAVHLSDQNYNPIPGTIIGIQYLNQIINVTVEHLCSGLTCGGQISVQDNIAPGLECRIDTIEINCTESSAPEQIGFPLPLNAQIVHIANNEYSVVVPGDCGGIYTLVYADIKENLNCGDDYDYTITRTWIATDPSGNSTSCVEYIGAVWGSFVDMTLPPHYDGLLLYGPNHLPKLQCSDASQNNYWPYDYNPGPDFTGYPEFSGCSNIQYYFEDLVFPICGNSRKIVRHWLILDWCTGQDFTYDQLIIIGDEVRPIVSAVRDTLYYPTNPGECIGTAYPIPAPNVFFDCSDWTYTISYKLRDESGNPFVNPITTNVFEGPEGFGISDLPVDTTWVMYTITDACGNQTVAFTEIVVDDMEAPTAICDKHTVVALTIDGSAKIFASSIDAGSNDNCALDRFEVRRMSTTCGYPEDLTFGDFVNFCCDDVGKTILVVFRAYDAKGFYSDCMVDVLVQDKMRPLIVDCPDNVTLNCGQDYKNLNLTGGKPVVDDNCDNFVITKRDFVNLSDCGIGYIRREWKVTDAGGLTATCRQYINIEGSNPLSNNDINWPADITLPGCTNSGAGPDVAGNPVVNNNGCKEIGIGYSDQVIDNVAGACVKILREWKIADWCETPPYTYVTHTQVIMLRETKAPVFTSCADFNQNSDNALCDATVTVSVKATDDCTPDNDLVYRWEIDMDWDGDIDFTGTGRAFTRLFSHGTHKVYYTVTDGCGNVANCSFKVRIIDTKDPTPICLAKVTTTMMSTGSVPIWARSFNVCQCSNGSFDNCTAKEDLRFSFSSNVNDTMRIFTCADITNGVAETFALEMWVTDLDGNQDFCNVELVIMDNVHACPDIPGASASLSGFVINENKIGMPLFEVKLEKDDTVFLDEFTDDNGQYVFENLDVYSKYKLKPTKDEDPSNGVSTLDLVLIQRHLLGLNSIDSPYKLIAADANNNGSISAADLLDIRSLILGLTGDFNKNESWRFINEKYEFENPLQPWDFEEDFVIDELYIGSDSIDFIGIKIGDVNNSAIENMLGNQLELRNKNVVIFEVPDLEFGVNEEIIVPITLTEDQLLTGFQFTFEYDAKSIEMVELSSAILNLSRQNINYFSGDRGLFTISWNEANPVEFNAGDEVLSMKIRSRQAFAMSESMKISSLYTEAEAYDENLELLDIELRFGSEINDMLRVYQNTPNPFSNETTINFYLPDEALVSCSIYDTNGKEIKLIKGHYSKGRNSITLTKDIFEYNGIYFFRIKTDRSSIVKKMIYTR